MSAEGSANSTTRSERGGQHRVADEVKLGQIIAAFGRQYLACLKDGSELACLTRGKKSEVVCGDIVEIKLTGDASTESDAQGVIERIAPRRSLLHRSDAFREKLIAANVTQIIVVETYNDIATWNPATQEWDHAPGTTLQSRAMNATVSEVPACADLVQITAQPQNTTGTTSGIASFSITVTAPAVAGGPAYQWRKDGVDIPDTDNPLLEIEDLTQADAGAYTCVITNDCDA